MCVCVCVCENGKTCAELTAWRKVTLFKVRYLLDHSEARHNALLSFDFITVKRNGDGVYAERIRWTSYDWISEKLSRATLKLVNRKIGYNTRLGCSKPTSFSLELEVKLDLCLVSGWRLRK